MIGKQRCKIVTCNCPTCTGNPGEFIVTSSCSLYVFVCLAMLAVGERIDIDSHQHHFEKRAVFAGCGVRAVGTNESNVY